MVIRIGRCTECKEVTSKRFVGLFFCEKCSELFKPSKSFIQAMDKWNCHIRNIIPKEVRGR